LFETPLEDEEPPFAERERLAPGFPFGLGFPVMPPIGWPVTLLFSCAVSDAILHMAKMAAISGFLIDYNFNYMKRRTCCACCPNMRRNILMDDFCGVSQHNKTFVISTRK
jgi:hypothetical protein